MYKVAQCCHNVGFKLINSCFIYSMLSTIIRKYEISYKNSAYLILLKYNTQSPSNSPYQLSSFMNEKKMTKLKMVWRAAEQVPSTTTRNATVQAPVQLLAIRHMQQINRTRFWFTSRIPWVTNAFPFFMLTIIPVLPVTAPRNSGHVKTTPVKTQVIDCDGLMHGKSGLLQVQWNL